MNNLEPITEHSDACKDAAHSAYGASDYNWQELCTDPVASQLPLLPPFTEAMRWLALVGQESDGLKVRTRQLSFPDYAASCSIS